jgi:hypothetical protein
MSSSLAKFSRNVNDEKGSLSNADIDRAASVLPQFFPGSRLFFGKGRTKENARRVEELEKILRTVHNKWLGGVNNIQRKAILERYGLRDPRLKLGAGLDEVK